MKRVSKPSSVPSALTYVTAFLLSGALGVVFVLFVNETHNFMAGNHCNAGIEGTWQGQWHGEPAVEITINQSGNQVSGTALFRSLKKPQVGAQIVSPPVSVSLKDVNFDGKTLRFKLADQVAATNSSLEMTLTGDKEAELKYVGCSMSNRQAETVRMIKTA